jgi:hypothetical protein
MSEQYEQPAAVEQIDPKDIEKDVRITDKRIIIKGGSLTIRTPVKFTEPQLVNGEWVYEMPASTPGHVPLVFVTSGPTTWKLYNLSDPQVDVIYR